jgi:hypothetical protein
VTEYLEPLRIVAHRARLLAAGEMDAQARQKFLRIAENLEAEALAEEPSEVQSTGDPESVVKGDPGNLNAARSVKAGSRKDQEPQVKKRRNAKKAGVI